MPQALLFTFCIPLLLSEIGHADSPPRFALKDGDRVVLIGNTLIEREQRDGYWETQMTIRFPGHISFRNLGWSGDTVWGEARAGFDTAKEGYERLIKKTLELKPTVIFIGYGANESFTGPQGLPAFRVQLQRLLHDLAVSKARMVLLAPPQFEQDSWRAGDLKARQHDLQLYADAIREIAADNKLLFANEFAQRYGPGELLTDDGFHLNPRGYWCTSSPLLHELGVESTPMDLVELQGLAPKQVLHRSIPGPATPPHTKAYQSDSLVLARGQKEGKYTLKIDGQPVHTASAEEWMKPKDWPFVLVRKGPSLVQAEKLRRTIVEKNRLYFCKWRPQNETYLFGFRKYEQGQNAKEIPEFDPLVEKLEKEIDRLKKPVPHTYQLVTEQEK